MGERVKGILAVLCLVLAGCTVTDTATGRVIVRSKSSPPDLIYDSLPATTYTAGGYLVTRVRIEADKVTCYQTAYGVSCLRDEGRHDATE